MLLVFRAAQKDQQSLSANFHFPLLVTFCISLIQQSPSMTLFQDLVQPLRFFDTHL